MNRNWKHRLTFGIAAAAMSLAAAGIPLDHGSLKMEFDTRGGAIGKISFQGTEMALPRPSVTDKLFASELLPDGERRQEIESFFDLDFHAEEKRGSRDTVFTFSARGTAAFDWCRVTKTYRVSRVKPEFTITWKLENLDAKPHSAGVWTATSFRNMGSGTNLFRQPRNGRETLLEHPGKVFSDEWSPEPGLAYLAVEGQNKAGLLVTFPPELVSGYYSWFSKVKTDSTLEWFLREQEIQPGKSVECTVTVQLSADIPSLLAKMNRDSIAIKSQKGKTALLPLKYGRKENGISESESKTGTMPQSGKYFDVSGMRQYCDSVRGARVSADTPQERIGVYEKRNNQADYDRPIPFTVKTLPSGEKQILFHVPGLNPDGQPYTGLENGRAQNRRKGNADLGENTFSYRIVLDRLPSQKLAPSLQAERADLIYNGSFEKHTQNPDWPDGYQALSYLRARKQYFYDAAHASDGKYSFRLNRPDPKQYCFMRNFFRVEESVGYHAGVMLKCDNPVKGDSVVYLEFFDRNGKRLEKQSLMETKTSYDWRKVEKKFFPPEGAVSAAFIFGVYGVGEQNLYIDDMRIVPDDFQVRAKSRREALRERIISGNYKELNHLEKISHEVETPHEKWLKPAAFTMPDVLYLTTLDSSNENTARRQIVEICQRMDLKYRYIPLLRAMERFPGGVFGVNLHITFAPFLEEYTMECLKEITETPPVTIVQEIDLKNAVQKEFITYLAGLQKKGSSLLFLNCRNIPRELLGEKIPTPPGIFLVPKMQNLSAGELDQACAAYRNGKSSVIVFHHFNTPYYMAPANFPSTPREMRGGTVPAYYSREYPYWEYIYLSLVKSLRWLAGNPGDAFFTENAGTELTVNAKKPMQAVLRALYKDRNRSVEGVSEQKLMLVQGENKVRLAVPELPGGIHIVDYRLMDEAQGKIHDAGALRFDTPETIRIGALKFDRSDRCFDPAGPVGFTVPLSGAYTGTEITCLLEDSENRVVAAQTLPAKADNRFTFALKAPHTLLYRVIVQVKQKGKLTAREYAEFTAPVPGRDLTDISAVMWIQRPEMNRKLRELGFDSLIVSYKMDGSRNGLFQNLANLNLRPVTMGCGYAGGNAFSAYKGDPPTDPVRKPCFHDPAYQARLRKTISETAEKFRYRYYNVREHFLGDETFIGSTVCYSPYSLKAFRAAMKKQYGSLDALNGVWESNFRSWDEVLPVQLNELRDKNNLSRWLDHKMFMAGVFAHEWLGRTASCLDEALPGSIAGLSGTQNPGYSYDWVQLMKHCSLLSYYDGIQCKVVHDFAPPVFVNGQWGGGYTTMEEHELFQKCPLWTNLFRGANLHAHYHGNAINGDISPTRNLIFYTDVIREMKRGIGKLFLSAKEDPAQIAVLYSQSSVFAALATIGGSEWQNAQNGWNSLLSDLKYRYRFLSYEELAAGRIQAKVLILPAALSLSRKETEEIRKFAEAGGTVIADILPGWYDEHGKKSASPVITRLFGKQPEHFKIVPIEGKHGKISGRFRTADASTPIMQSRTIGKGRAVLMNLVLSGYQNIELAGVGGEISTTTHGPEALCQALRSLVSELIPVSGICKVTDGKGGIYPCLTAFRRDGDNAVFGILKHSLEGRRFDVSKAVPVTVTLPVSGHLYDVRNGVYHGCGSTIQTKLVPGQAQLFSILKEKVESVRITTPEEFTRGGMLPVTISAGSGSQVFHLEFLAPDGKAAPLYARNLRFENGSGTYSFQTALNDAPGRWTLVVKNVNSGLSAKHCINLKQ